MAQLRFLASFAHPDDEAFSCAGVMALNRCRNIQNTLICATQGEAGEISDPALATRENLGAVRARELADAGEKMGLDALHFLGYRDSGMADTEDNHHPNAFAQAPADAVVPRLVRFLRTIQPQVVVTFDPTGGYGHPDHIAIHRHTLRAVEAAADPGYHPDLGEPWQVARIFYPAIKREMFDQIREAIIRRGGEPPDWGVGEDGEPEWPEQPIHAAIDIRQVIDTKWAALTAHRTQFGQNHPFRQAGEDFIKSIMGEEFFELAWPEEKPEQPLHDLFDGLDSPGHAL